MNKLSIHLSLYRDGVMVLSPSEPGTVIVDSLSPYTLYTVQVEACTQFGCTTLTCNDDGQPWPGNELLTCELVDETLRVMVPHTAQFSACFYT